MLDPGPARQPRRPRRRVLRPDGDGGVDVGLEGGWLELPGFNDDQAIVDSGVNPALLLHNFYDAFPSGEDLSAHWYGAAGLWTCNANNNLKALANNGINLPLLFTGFARYTDVSIRAHLTNAASAFAGAGLCLHSTYSGTPPSDTADGYSVALTRPSWPLARLRIYGHGGAVIATSPETLQFSDGDELALVYQSQFARVQALINGVPVLEGFDSSLPTGRCGVFVSDNTVQFMDCQITDLRRTDTPALLSAVYNSTSHVLTLTFDQSVTASASQSGSSVGELDFADGGARLVQGPDTVVAGTTLDLGTAAFAPPETGACLLQFSQPATFLVSTSSGLPVEDISDFPVTVI